MNNKKNNNNLESRLANLEEFYQSQFEELCQKNNKIKRDIEEIERQIEDDALEEKLIDTIAERVIEKLRKEGLID